MPADNTPKTNIWHCAYCLPAQQVDDENHCLFRCTRPLLQEARDDLFHKLLKDGDPVPSTVPELFKAAGQSRKLVRQVTHFVAFCYHVVRDAPPADSLQAFQDEEELQMVEESYLLEDSEFEDEVDQLDLFE